MQGSRRIYGWEESKPTEEGASIRRDTTGAGGATGEEAYAIAMLLREYMERTQNRCAVQICAADVPPAMPELKP